jgi:hypothetical protein
MTRPEINRLNPETKQKGTPPGFVFANPFGQGGATQIGGLRLVYKNQETSLNELAAWLWRYLTV